MGYEKWSDSVFLGYNYYENFLVFLLFLPVFRVIWKTKYTILLSEFPSKTYVNTDFGDGIPLRPKNYQTQVNLYHMFQKQQYLPLE